MLITHPNTPQNRLRLQDEIKCEKGGLLEQKDNELTGSIL